MVTEKSYCNNKWTYHRGTNSAVQMNIVIKSDTVKRIRLATFQQKVKGQKVSVRPTALCTSLWRLLIYPNSN